MAATVWLKVTVPAVMMGLLRFSQYIEVNSEKNNSINMFVE